MNDKLMLPLVKTVRQLEARYTASPERVRQYFRHTPALVKHFPLEVCLSYMFAEVERAHHMILYCGIVKFYKTDSAMTWRVLTFHHMTRDDFQVKFKTVFGKAFSSVAYVKLRAAEQVRDQVMHGKSPSDALKRNAIADLLVYATEMNEHLQSIAGFQPFGDLRGFKGAAKSLDQRTTRWILKGMGLAAG